MPIGPEKLLARRQRILGCARDLIAQLGYERVTIRALAEASGVTVPTLYNTFGSKDALLYEAVVEAFEELIEATGPARGVRGLDRALAIVNAIVTTMTNEPAYAKTLLESFRSISSAAEIGRAIKASGRQALTEALEEMRTDGDLEPWVEVDPLVDRIQAHQLATSQAWLTGAIPSGRFLAATTFGTCLMLGGVARGTAAERCRAEARECQRLLAEPFPSPK